MDFKFIDTPCKNPKVGPG